MYLSPEDWDAVEDIFSCAVDLAESLDPATHSRAASKYAVERLQTLALYANKKAALEREKAERAKLK